MNDNNKKYLILKHGKPYKFISKDIWDETNNCYKEKTAFRQYNVYEIVIDDYIRPLDYNQYKDKWVFI